MMQQENLTRMQRRKQRRKNLNIRMMKVFSFTMLALLLVVGSIVKNTNHSFVPVMVIFAEQNHCEQVQEVEPVEIYQNEQQEQQECVRELKPIILPEVKPMELDVTSSQERKEESLMETETIEVDSVDEVTVEEESFSEDMIVYQIPEEVTEDNGYTQEEVSFLADVIYLEVGGSFIKRLPLDEAEYGCKLAGSVVLHRMNDSRYPNTIKGVVFDEGQYSEKTKSRIGRVEVPEEIYEWAEDLLRDGPIGPSNLIFQSRKARGYENYEVILGEYFCLG